MRKTISVLCAGVVTLAVLMLRLPAAQAQAQGNRVPSRVTTQVDDTRTVQTKGNVHPLALPQFDRGAVADSQPMTRMLLLLQRSEQQERDLQQLMDRQQTKGTANYHAWLTPEQFGKQFGPSDSDVQAVTDWLTRQGFQVSKVAAGRTAIEFSGNVAQVRNAFHTEVHKFAVNGETHVANAGEPSIPAALAPVVKGVVALNDFPRRPQVHKNGVYRWNRNSGEVKPLFTFGTPANFVIGPGDFNKIYNVPVTATGLGQTIVVIGQSNIDPQDVCDFRSIFGLTPACPAYTAVPNGNLQIVVNGPDPGLQLFTGDEGESILDVEWAGAVAPAANIVFVTSASTISNPGQITNGVDLSALYAVDHNLGSVISESYGQCEPFLGSAGNQFFNSLWEQAAAQGITVVVSSGDNGSAGCDPDLQPNVATDGLAVSGIASTPFNVAVGGTDVDPSTLNSTFWNTTSGTINSALGYIPETTWDDSACALNASNPCNSVDTTNNADISAASGGPSNCATFSGSNCSAGYARPAYQTNFNTQFPTVRTIPDVSLFASNGGPLVGGSGVAIVVCQADDPNIQNGASCSLASPFLDFALVGGTSAATPPFGAIAALVSQANGGQRLGNMNFGLYALAAADANYANGSCRSSVGFTPNGGCVFNDVSKGNIAVACQKGVSSVVNGQGTAWCQGSGGTFGVTVSNSSPAFGASPGYDLATGLGSINVTNLLTQWSTITRSATTTTVNTVSGGTPSGTNFTAAISVSPAASTGDVSLTALKSDQSVLASFGPFKLSGGTVNAQTNLLPPGTAFVTATYGGDATHGMSTSVPKALSSTVAGAGFASSTQLNFVTFDNGGNPIPTTQAKTVAYGSDYIMNILVKKSGDSSTCGFSIPNTTPTLPCPTGTITLTDNGSALNDFAKGAHGSTNQPGVSNQGFVEDFNVQLGGGAHSIVATFTTGDTNYQNSTSNTLNVTITPAQTTTSVASNLGTISSGASVILTAVVGSTSNSSQGPTGTVQFQNNGANIGSPVTCTAVGASGNAGASCSAQLTTTISALFPPGARGPQPRIPVLPLALALVSVVCFLLGLRWMPEKRRRAYAYAGFVFFALLAVGVAGCGGGSGGGGGGGGKTVTIKASYAGDTNYASSSGTGTITVN